MPDEIEMVPLASSNLAAAGYDAETRTLRIEFQSGSTYDYSGVSQEVNEGLKTSPSPGGYFFRNIRDRYPTERIS